MCDLAEEELAEYLAWREAAVVRIAPQRRSPEAPGLPGSVPPRPLEAVAESA